MGTTSQYILYIYSADGTKLAKVATDGVTKTYYAGEMVYSGSSLAYILHPEGMHIPGSRYQYYLKDHLGKTRLVVNTSGTGGTIVQQTDYYPFGMDIACFSSGLNNSYRYNGKEMQPDKIGDKNLDWYDYGARFYDPTLGRWHSVDPLAEKSRRWNPYSYCYNNPLIFVDLDGLKPVWNGEYGNESKYIDDETNKEDSWNQVQNYMNYGNYDGPKEIENGNESSHTITPFRVGEEWLSGNGEKTGHLLVEIILLNC